MGSSYYTVKNANMPIIHNFKLIKYMKKINKEHSMDCQWIWKIKRRSNNNEMIIIKISYNTYNFINFWPLLINDQNILNWYSLKNMQGHTYQDFAKMDK